MKLYGVPINSKEISPTVLLRGTFYFSVFYNMRLGNFLKFSLQPLLGVNGRASGY